MNAPDATVPQASITTPSQVPLDLNSVKWDDVKEDEEGCATGIFDKKWTDFKSKQLRVICSRLSIRGVKNARKADMIEALVRMYRKKKGGNDMNSTDSGRSTPSDGTPTKKTVGKKRKGNDAGDASREFGNSQMHSDLTKQKLLYMEKEDSRQNRQALLHEWETIQNNIRLLRQDIREEVTDSSARKDIEEDIKCLVKRKNRIAVELGFK